jgi:hypothetical protein
MDRESDFTVSQNFTLFAGIRDSARGLKATAKHPDVFLFGHPRHWLALSWVVGVFKNE